MCGRYTLSASATDLWQRIASIFPAHREDEQMREQLDAALQIPERRQYNIVPTSYEPILYLREKMPVLKPAHWWILPPWGVTNVTWRRSGSGEKTFSWIGPPKSHFNSRWDTITSPGNRYWHNLLDSKRCLIPADGFMEWPDDALRPKNREKIPHFYGLRNRVPFFFAGLFDETTDDEGRPFLSYNIITVEPNEMLRQLPHHRMPAILNDNTAAKWLESATNATEAAKLLQPLAENQMMSYPISKLVNSSANESRNVIERWDESENDPMLL